MKAAKAVAKKALAKEREAHEKEWAAAKETLSAGFIKERGNLKRGSKLLRVGG